MFSPGICDRIDDEPVRLLRPDFGDVFVRREATERIKPTGEIIGCFEVCEEHPQLFVALVMEALDGRISACAVHSLDLTVGPRVVRLGQPVLEVVCIVDHVEAHLP